MIKNTPSKWKLSRMPWPLWVQNAAEEGKVENALAEAIETPGMGTLELLEFE